MAGQTPKITALVPSYNHARYLRQRIESILAQTYKNVELIVIDDCSPDNSDEVIQALLKEHAFTYIRNAQNSGTPFSAWERAAALAAGDYIWICESDDYADPGFLAEAVDKLAQTPQAVLFYCQSWVVDEDNQKVGHTESYFHDIWKETRWDSDFTAAGKDELAGFQVRGQTVPNMSSALIAKPAFQHACDPFLKRLKLTGDWLFVGYLMAQGAVAFSSKTLSHFRQHEVTSRVRVKSARSQAEFMLTKHLLFQKTGRPLREFAAVMKNDAIRFLHEPASAWEVLRALLDISPAKTLGLALALAASVAMDAQYLKKFYLRHQMVKQG
jgi:glycosyltransferase involved in cell wall biosynthesis